MLFTFFMSLFCDPYIASCHANNGIITLEIYFRENECGFIRIESEHVTSYISCGLKIFKGHMKREDIYFKYERKKLKIISKKTNKTRLKVKCSKEIHKQIKHEFESLKYNI